MQEAREYCIREQKPILVECMTFRMRGHEEASGVKYVPKELFEQWGKLDPVMNFENYLLEEMTKRIGREYVLTYYSSKPDCQQDDIKLGGERYPLIKQSPNEYEYTEIIAVKREG